MNPYPKGADKYIIFNDTDGLIPIVIEIEKIIRWAYEYYNEPLYFPLPEKMDNYNLPKEKQYFHFPVTPVRLQNLVKHSREVVRKRKQESDSLKEQLVIAYIRKFLTENAKDFQEELQWIRDMWYYRLFGYWFINNGKPTYITGIHFSYLFSYDLGGAEMKFRMVDRKRFLIDDYAFFAKETFEKLDENGIAIPEPDGTYKMIATKNRTIMGITHPKSRREGSTAGFLERILNRMTLTIGSDCLGVIQSFGGDSSQKIYENKLLAAFRKKPFFFKPIWSGSNNPKNKLTFVPDSSDLVETPLECTIVPATTVDRKTFDGQKIFEGLFDEEGKTDNTDIQVGWGIIKETMKQGDEIHGFAAHPSTVEEIGGDMSDRYELLCNQSDFYRRDPLTGRTQSGLIMYFMDAAEFYTEGFLDRYGFTVMNNPTQEQAEFIGKKHGSIEALESQAKQILNSTDPDKEKNFRDFRRRYPRTIKDVFLSTAGDIGFNLTKLDDRLTELKIIKKKEKIVKTGKYRWKNDRQDTEVEFVEDENGFWELSDEPPIHIKNKKIRSSVVDFKGNVVPTYAPMFPGHYISSSDPYRFSEKSEQQLIKDKSKISLGGISTLEDRKDSDKDDVPIELWEGLLNVATFIGRYVDENIYCEQVLMNSVYWGAMHSPETNLETVWKYFIERGYAGYLLYDYDRKTNKYRSYPGFNASHRKNDLFKELNFYIEFRIHKDCHQRFIEQCIKIRSMKEMTNYDLIPPVGGCLMALKNESWQLIKKMSVAKKYSKSDFY